MTWPQQYKTALAKFDKPKRYVYLFNGIHYSSLDAVKKKIAPHYLRKEVETITGKNLIFSYGQIVRQINVY